MFLGCLYTRVIGPSPQHKRTLVLRVLRIDAKLAESASQHVNKRDSSLIYNCQEAPSLPLGLSLTAIAGAAGKVMHTRMSIGLGCLA